MTLCKGWTRRSGGLENLSFRLGWKICQQKICSFLKKDRPVTAVKSWKRCSIFLNLCEIKGYVPFVNGRYIKRGSQFIFYRWQHRFSLGFARCVYLDLTITSWLKVSLDLHKFKFVLRSSNLCSSYVREMAVLYNSANSATLWRSQRTLADFMLFINRFLHF